MTTPYLRPKRCNRTGGYSLFEVLIVLAIIALIAVLVGPRLFGQLDRAKQTAAKVQVKALYAAVETMRLDFGRYPTGEEGLAALTQAPQVSDDETGAWRGPYLDEVAPNDPWGRAYVYEAPQDGEGRPRVGTFGADGKPGGDGLNDDIFVGAPQQ
jgi:general secretion pathway protein G